jgi:hypothetical protein
MNYANMFASSNNNKTKADSIDQKHKLRTHGKDMWNTLHTFSAYLPEKLSNSEIEDMTGFVNGVLYYGTKFNLEWHDETQKYIEKNPYNFTTRDNSMLWICNFHNHVNRKLEKDLFECTKENLGKRWGNYIKIKEDHKNNIL